MPKKTRIIAVANHKGGCGKTSTAVNLAAELGRKGLNVLLVDLDPQANASLHVGKDHPAEVPVTCAKLLTGDLDQLQPSIHEDTHFDNVHLIYGSLDLDRAEEELRHDSPRPNEELAYKLEPVVGVYDVVLLDCPPSLKLLTSNALAAATDVLVPIESGDNYGLYGIANLMLLVRKIQRINKDLNMLGCLLIRHDRRQLACQIIEQAAEQEVGKLLPVTISNSTKVKQAVMLHKSVHGLDHSCKVAREFRQLAEHLAKEFGFKLEEQTNV